MRKFAILLTTVASLAAALPVCAQDVVMRRPLPQSKGLTQTSCDPADPGCTSTPTPDDPFRPGNPTPGGQPGPGTYVYQWDVGEWQGTSTCGVQTTLTRTVTCRGFSTGGIGIGGVSAIDGDGRVMNASYDPSRPPGLMQVQLNLPGLPGLPGGPGGFDDDVFDASYCVQNVGPQPAAQYAGTGAGCEYTPSTVTPQSVDDGTAINVDRIDTSWKLPENDPGTVSCSNNAYRHLPFTCTDQEGRTVANSYCIENPTQGGTRNEWLPETQTGNYAGCSAHWETRDSNLGCHPSGDPYGNVGGASHYVNRQSVCVSSSGQVLTGPGEAACDIDPDRPFGGVVEVGSCIIQAAGDSHDKRCVGSITKRVPLVRQNRDLGKDPAVEAATCFNAGSTCVSGRVTADGNYALEPNNTYELICTSGTPQQYSGSHYYVDECDNSNGGECPIFYNNGNYKKVWTPAD